MGLDIKLLDSVGEAAFEDIQLGYVAGVWSLFGTVGLVEGAPVVQIVCWWRDEAQYGAQHLLKQPL